MGARERVWQRVGACGQAETCVGSRARGRKWARVGVRAGALKVHACARANARGANARVCDNARGHVFVTVRA
eukprot:6184657-Pleurochrysis_carterae.AAC.2